MRLLICALLLVLGADAGSAKSHRKRHSTTTTFDSYLLVLSWSPEFCHNHATNSQCTGGKHLGFVVHGLWPEYQTGGGPENCSSRPGLADPSKMLDTMPTLKLIDHEWSTHGTCSGLNADDYFALIRKAYLSIERPAKFASTESPQQVKKDFELLNGNLTGNELIVSCTSNYLKAVEICLGKDLTPTACAVSRDCRASRIQISPVQ